MTKTIKYTDAPADIEQALDSATTMEDFLPSPADLVRKTEREKITLAIDKRTLELYRRYAKKHDAKYQTMLNSILVSYADKFLSHK